MLKLENKEMMWKATREKCQLTYKSKHKNHLRPPITNPRSQQNMEQYNSSSERREQLLTKNTLSSKAVLQSQWKNKYLPGKG
jgi:hypothetical protein